MNSILIWLVAALFGFGTVSQSSSMSAESAAPAPVEAQSAAEPSRAVEQRFAEREMLPPCGMLDVTRPSRGTAAGIKLSPPRQAWRCLGDSVGVGGAELVTLDLRRNGATVHTFYRTTRDGRLEIWTQRTRNAPGRMSSRWAYGECTPSEDLRRQPCAS